MLNCDEGIYERIRRAVTSLKPCNNPPCSGQDRLGSKHNRHAESWLVNDGFMAIWCPWWIGPNLFWSYLDVPNLTAFVGRGLWDVTSSQEAWSAGWVPELFISSNCQSWADRSHWARCDVLNDAGRSSICWDHQKPGMMFKFQVLPDLFLMLVSNDLLGHLHLTPKSIPTALVSRIAQADPVTLRVGNRNKNHLLRGIGGRSIDSCKPSAMVQLVKIGMARTSEAQRLAPRQGPSDVVQVSLVHLNDGHRHWECWCPLVMHAGTLLHKRLFMAWLISLAGFDG